MAVRRSKASRPPRRTRPATGPPTTEFERRIYDRIGLRLGQRIRNLGVSVSHGVIHLTGECSTYYSKQLAQHAVLGVVEDETVRNEIDVMVPTPSSARK